MLLEIIIATLVISLTSLVGALVVSKTMKKFLHYFVSFAAGTLLAITFFDLIPESLEYIPDMHIGLLFTLLGILVFFLIERFIHWHHCDHCGHGHSHKSIKPAGSLILFGGLLHNFVDGLIIAGAFFLDFSVGLLTAVMILIHEIPHSFGKFAILINSGFTRYRALFLNFLTALTAILGGLAGYFAFSFFDGIVPYVVAFAAGGFLYIALSDIMPELHQHKGKIGVILLETAIFLLTIIIFYFLIALVHVH